MSVKIHFKTLMARFISKDALQTPQNPQSGRPCEKTKGRSPSKSQPAELITSSIQGMLVRDPEIRVCTYDVIVSNVCNAEFSGPYP